MSLQGIGRNHLKHTLEFLEKSSTSLDDIDKSLFDVLNTKEDGYTIQDIEWLAAKLVERQSMTPLLHMDMMFRKYLSIDTLSSMYNHLDEIDQNIKKLNEKIQDGTPHKWLNTRQEPRYVLLWILLQWKNNESIDYENIPMGSYKHLPSEIQQSIYEHLKSRKTLSWWAFWSQAKYLHICSILEKPPVKITSN